jgi:two-component system, NarL family, sensor histidine kinase UhpB
VLVTSVIRDITDRKRVEAERTRLFDQLQHLSRQLLLAQENERRHIARELHDESGQALTALKIRLEMLKADLPSEDTTLRHQLATAVDMVDATMERMRSLALALRPPALDAVGLNAALEGCCQSFAEHTLLVVDYAAAELPIVPDPIGICLYRFLQEALTNIAKHAHARRIWIVLQRDAEEISLSVEDDGEGFDPATLRSSTNRLTHMGLLGMRERLQLLGGRLDVDLQAGRGVHLVAHIPWRDSK